MTDRELLEKAAKAAGMAVDTEIGLWNWCDHGRFNGGMYRMHRTILEYWNPLTDDGDALRLAVKLCIEVSPNDGVIVVNYPVGKDRLLSELHIIIEGDRYAATRRAIVRAATAIGEAL